MSDIDIDNVNDNSTDNGADNDNVNDNDIRAHLDQGLLKEWRAIEVAGELIVMYDVPEWNVEGFRVVGTTTNVRAIATADALIYDGSVVKPWFDDETRRVLLQHAFAGTEVRLNPSEWLDDPVVILEECDHIDLAAAIDNSTDNGTDNVNDNDNVNSNEASEGELNVE